jgi:hypothetical protein
LRRKQNAFLAERHPELCRAYCEATRLVDGVPVDRIRWDGAVGRVAALIEVEGWETTWRLRGLQRRAMQPLKKHQLVNKHLRFLLARRPRQYLTIYNQALIGDDPVEAKGVFDAVDRMMREEDWDDMRQWWAQHGVAA